MKILDWYFRTSAQLEAALWYAKEHARAPANGETGYERLRRRCFRLHLALWAWKNGVGGMATAMAWASKERIFGAVWERRLNGIFSLLRLKWRAELGDDSQLRILKVP